MASYKKIWILSHQTKGNRMQNGTTVCQFTSMPSNALKIKFYVLSETVIDVFFIFFS